MGWGILSRIGLVALVLCTSTIHADLLPWPWGGRCAFPWEEIQGVWAPASKISNERYLFRIRKNLHGMPKVLSFSHYRGDELIGQGKARFKPYQQQIRVRVEGVGRELGSSYIMSIGNYAEQKYQNCAEGHRIMVITVSTVVGGASKSHVVIDKIADGSNISDP